MYNMKSAKHKCPNCNTTWQTKKTFDMHTSVCGMIHTSAKEHEINRDYDKMELPSQKAMFHYLVQLTQRFDDMEKKLAKIQQNTFVLRRKNIAEYLKTLPKPQDTYTQWLNSIEITEPNLKRLFETDLEECIKIVIDTDRIPLRAFAQKPSTFYLYDEAENGWREFSKEEFVRMVSSISHKILKAYMKWAKEHQEELTATPKAEEQSMIYMSKANGFNRSSDSRASNVKKWLYGKISQTIANLEA